FEVEALTAEQAANVALNKYAFVVVSAVGSAPPSFESNLNSYVRNGGGVLIALGPASAAAGPGLVTGDRVTRTRDAARAGDRYENAAQVDRSYPPLSGAGSLETVKFYQAERVEPVDARIAARLNDGTPLLYEKRVGEGRAVVLTSTLDNISNDFPLHASFV